jgi:hypothetical protein
VEATSKAALASLRCSQVLPPSIFCFLNVETSLLCRAHASAGEAQAENTGLTAQQMATNHSSWQPAARGHGALTRGRWRLLC